MNYDTKIIIFLFSDKKREEKPPLSPTLHVIKKGDTL